MRRSLALTWVILGGLACGTDITSPNTNTGTNPDAGVILTDGGVASDLDLSRRLDRVGRPGIEIAIIGTATSAEARAEARRSYNTTSPTVAATLQNIQTLMARVLPQYDALDGMCGNANFSTTSTPAWDAILTDDRLYVDTSTSGANCSSLVPLTEPLAENSPFGCAGRQLDDDVIDDLYRNLIGPSATDGVDVPSDLVPTEGFPFIPN